jgi:hypothetical protein
MNSADLPAAGGTAPKQWLRTSAARMPGPGGAAAPGGCPRRSSAASGGSAASSPPAGGWAAGMLWGRCWLGARRVPPWVRAALLQRPAEAAPEPHIQLAVSRAPLMLRFEGFCSMEIRLNQRHICRELICALTVWPWPWPCALIFVCCMAYWCQVGGDSCRLGGCSAASVVAVRWVLPASDGTGCSQERGQPPGVTCMVLWKQGRGCCHSPPALLAAPAAGPRASCCCL